MSFRSTHRLLIMWTRLSNAQFWLLLTFLFAFLNYIFFFGTMIVNCFGCDFLFIHFFSAHFFHISLGLKNFCLVYFSSALMWMKKNNNVVHLVVLIFSFELFVHMRAKLKLKRALDFVHQTSMSELINRIKVKKPVSEQDQTQFGMDVDVCFSKLILSVHKHTDAFTQQQQQQAQIASWLC